VLDTSVAVKWHLVEELSDEAARLLDSVGSTVSELLAPSTIEPEFFNTFWQRHRRGDITLDEVRQGWSDFVFGEPATLYAPEDLMPRAVEITFETRTIIYDALFLALAEDFGTTLVTADGKLLRAIEGTAFAHLAHPLARLGDLAL
jgi:predicted nucleic acid-binding protein